MDYVRAMLIGFAVLSCQPAAVTGDSGDAGADAPVTDGGGATEPLDSGQLPDAGADAGDADAGPVADAGVPSRTFRVLFDAAHANAVGNADWVLDGEAPDPVPVHPTSEAQWSGGISAWGFDLHAGRRYDVWQLPPGVALTFGGGGSGDLRDFDVFISDEPEKPFSTAEQAALMQFAQAGGGLFLVADHLGAKRCTTCTEAWRVINDFLQTGAGNAFGLKCDGNNIAQGGLTGSPTAAAVAAHFTSGHFGAAARLTFYSGTSVSVSGGNPAAVMVVSSTAGGMMAASSLPSGGRVVLLGDSSPADDGTCTNCGAKLYDGWGEVDNAEFILNATAWLAHDGS
ncbi:MAG: hypothetical protein ACYC8T_22425 [Myxococcaceae bacterium]